jgi:hypothetical protein
MAMTHRKLQSSKAAICKTPHVLLQLAPNGTYGVWIVEFPSESKHFFGLPVISESFIPQAVQHIKLLSHTVLDKCSVRVPATFGGGRGKVQYSRCGRGLTYSTVVMMYIDNSGIESGPIFGQEGLIAANSETLAKVQHWCLT